MKCLTVIGTRPEIVRLSKVIAKLDKVCQQVLVFTGQSFSDNMSKVFFEELDIRKPDETLKIGGESATRQIAELFIQIEQLIYHHEPDRLLILGDTNSALAAVVAKRMGVKVYHMEAGNRSFDTTMPEEVNRRIIDHVSDIHMPYTERARENLVREGIPVNKIFVVGNPIREVLNGIPNGRLPLDVKPNQYFLVTAHRQENVSDKYRLSELIDSCAMLPSVYDMPVIFSRHPRTAKQMEAWGITGYPIQFHEPLPLFDFVNLERKAFCVLTDSGTVQEECCILGVPCVTLRDNTERPETIECGSNILSGVESENVLRCVKLALSNKGRWTVPAEYILENVSDTVANIVGGF